MPTPPVPPRGRSAELFFVHDKNGTVYGWNIPKKAAQSLVDELKREGAKGGRAVLRSAAADKITDQIRAKHPHLVDAESFAHGVAALTKAVPKVYATPPAPELEEVGPEEGDLSDEELAEMEQLADDATRAATVPGAPSGELVAEATPARASTVNAGDPAPQAIPVPGRVVDASGRITDYPPPATVAPAIPTETPAPATVAPGIATEADPVPTVEEILDEDDDGLAGLRM